MVYNIVIVFMFISFVYSLCSKINFKKTNIFKLHKSTSKNIFLDSEAGTGLEGHDARNTYDDTDEELFKIKKYLEMKKLLIMLESDKISTNNKLDIISNYDLLEYKLGENIYAGGLLDDWNF